MVEAFRPSSLAEALRIRASRGAVPLGGGTDLMVKLRRGAGAVPGFDRPVLLLDGIEELRELRLDPGAVEIGSMTTLARIAESPMVHQSLRDAVLHIGGPALRNVATIGGNICNASPAADTLPFLYAFGAGLRIVSEAGERMVSIEDFITGPGKIGLGPSEILASVIVPAWEPEICFWRKVGTRKANALTKVSIAAFADVEDGVVRAARISLGAVAPTIVRLWGAEELISGVSLDELSGKAGEVRAACAGAVRPIDDQRSTAEYRARVAANLTEEFLRAASRRRAGVK
jgi:CO/xanthine dehydrogenase FAD-binding subunit